MITTTCPTCCKYQKNRAAPIPTRVLERSWQKVATDLFYYNGKTYIDVVNYYSRFFKIAFLKSTTTENAISHLKRSLVAMVFQKSLSLIMAPI